MRSPGNCNPHIVYEKPRSVWIALCLSIAVVSIFGLSARAASILVSCDTGLGQSEPFQLSCREEAPGARIRDPEFNQEEFLVTWRVGPKLNPDGTVRRHGRVYIAPVDDQTGEILADRAITSKNTKPVPTGSVVNGPEWANSQRGWEIFYSCYSANLATVRICKISRENGRPWRISGVPATNGKSSRNYTLNPLDLDPKLYFEHQQGTIAGGLTGVGFGWRFDTGSPVDTDMPPGSAQGRWLPDGTGLLHLKRLNENGRKFTQLFLYNTADQSDTRLFFDGRERKDPFAWFAPELGFRLAFMAIVENQAAGAWDVEAYRQDESGNWVLWNVIEPICSAHPINFSPEPFVFQGKSYVSLLSLQGTHPRDFRTQPGVVWIASVDPALPESERVRRIVSDPSCDAGGLRRSDPETLILMNGNNARVYYLEFNSNP